jgi:hypothetical protein
MAYGIGAGLRNGLAKVGTSVTNGLSPLVPATVSAVSGSPISAGGGGRSSSTNVTINAGAVLSFANEAELEMKLKPLIMKWVNA